MASYLVVLEAVLRLRHFRPLLAAVGERLVRGGRGRQRVAVVPAASVHFHGEWPIPDVVDVLTAAATSVEEKRMKTINWSRNNKSKIDEIRSVLSESSIEKRFQRAGGRESLCCHRQLRLSGSHVASIPLISRRFDLWADERRELIFNFSPPDRALHSPRAAPARRRRLRWLGRNGDYYFIGSHNRLSAHMACSGAIERWLVVRTRRRRRMRKMHNLDQFDASRAREEAAIWARTCCPSTAATRLSHGRAHPTHSAIAFRATGLRQSDNDNEPNEREKLGIINVAEHLLSERK